MKNLDLNNYSVQEMNAEEMKMTDGGWMFFGSQTKQGRAILDPTLGWGYEYTTTTYVFGIAVSSESGIMWVS